MAMAVGVDELTEDKLAPQMESLFSEHEYIENP
jgi:hypothetical protein